METAERRAAAALWCIPRVGSRTIEQIRKRLGSLGDLLDRRVSTWASCVELPRPQQEALLGESRALGELADWLEHRLSQLGHAAVFPGDPAWPPRLLEIDPAPEVLFMLGPGAAVAPRRRAAVVGTRHPEPGVCERVHGLAKELAQAGMGVISGAAEGVDQAAHLGAIEGGGETWAFLGSALDQLGAPQEPLVTPFRDGGGTFYSQEPPGTGARAWTFVRRNPLISGASEVVLVARAPSGSGALITAEAALAQGRPLLAIPADPWNEAAKGGNELLRAGKAAVCLSAAEVLDAVGLTGVVAQVQPQPAQAAVSDQARALLELMSTHGSDVDSLGARSGLEVGRVISLLVELQLAGLVLQKGGGRFERKAGGPRAQSIVDLAGASN